MRRSSSGLLVLAPLALATLAGCPHEISVPPTLELTSASAARASSLPSQFKLVEFNVHGRPGEVVAQALASDPALADADLMVMPESANWNGCSTACALARKLGMYSAYLPRYYADQHTEGIGIVSRVPLENVRVFVLPEIPTLIHGEGNNAIVAELRIGGRTVTLYAVHLTLRLNAGERVRQLRPVLEDARTRNTPVLLVGDFNTMGVVWVGHIVPLPVRSQTKVVERLVRSYGFATPVTGSGSTARVLPTRIDAIYTRGFATSDYGTSVALAISDHRALWARVAVR